MTELVPPPSTSRKSLMERVEDALLPLINLVFLLLMFFIVAGQLADDPLPDLPATPPGAAQQPPHADLLVDAEGNWRISGKTLDAQTLLQRLPAPDAQKPLKIAAASTIAMADLEALLRTLEQGGYEEILLLTEPGS
ncbi:MAG: biopolymer transporter ExbD [Marinobacter sp.]|uniref:ExbD/TolR family protein n=1 Tax=Marinobacter sp. TaxID=50741 RepID=UPI001B6D1085|nr:biopolymer transporter ExbD [Marinobacter sp.]MBQ0746045.1 biopolymer transporter ExbD [Marinobacter sp.]MBQ0814538.1 biopolymer transporter ExbD [Marinobacter sp.]|tara:strand:- start:224 stop:634 length:411 start_codon:yes stop_codon:yes gene_type:complete